MINVFLPTTPNPTSGFYLVIPEEDTIPLDISVEDAFKLLISGGVVEPGGKIPPFLFGRKQRNARMQQMLAQKGQLETPGADSGQSGDQSEDAEKMREQSEDKSLEPAGNRRPGTGSAGETDLPES